jgi:iron complex outermembrane receptor protein
VKLKSARARAQSPVRIAVATALAAAYGNAHAQDADTDPARLEEVVVTAQKKEQSVIDVPISMSVLGEAELEALRVEEVQDFVFTVPNVSYWRAAPQESTITIRGIGGNGGGRFTPTKVTVDDASFGSTSNNGMLTSRLLDAERIEVLRGPQGTLTGSSALGGMVNIITRKPQTDAFHFDGVVDYSRFNTQLLKGSLNTPVSDALAFRTVAYVESSDGAVRNIGPSGGDSGFDNFGARIAARYQPSDRMTIDTSFSSEEQRYGINNSLHLDQFYPNDMTREEAAAELAAAGADYFTTDFITDVGNDGGTIHTDIPVHTDIETQVTSLKASYDLAAHNVSFLYTGFDYTMDNLRDRDKSELAITRQDRGIDQHADSAELRISSRYAGNLNWVGGINYASEDLRWLESGLLGDGTIGGRYPDFHYHYQMLNDFESWDAFGNIFWDIGDRWHLSAGARYSRTESASMVAFDAADSSNERPTAPFVTAELSEFNPRVAVNFDLSANSTMYVQYATGFRAGYANNPLATGVQDVFPIGIIDVPADVTAEQVKNYEVGFKGRFLDGRLAVTAAAFQMDYSDLQIFGGTITLDEGYVYADLNAGEAYTRGFEIEAAGRPTEHLELRANVGYVETQLEEFLGEEIEGDASIADVRPWLANASAIYDWDMQDGLRGHARLDYNWQAKTEPRFAEALDSVFLPEFSVVNLSAGVERDRWSVVAYMDNVLDEIYWLGDTGGPTRRGIEAYFIPRTFGLRFSVHFGGGGG